MNLNSRDGSPLGRQTKNDVILESRLRPVLQKLNPGLPPEAFSQAIDEINRDRSLMSSVQANREVYTLLKDGVKVKVAYNNGNETTKVVQVVDWENPGNNDFFLASQFWVTGGVTRAPGPGGFCQRITAVISRV